MKLLQRRKTTQQQKRTFPLARRERFSPRRVQGDGCSRDLLAVFISHHDNDGLCFPGRKSVPRPRRAANSTAFASAASRSARSVPTWSVTNFRLHEYRNETGPSVGIVPGQRIGNETVVNVYPHQPSREAPNDKITSLANGVHKGFCAALRAFLAIPE